MLSEHYSYHTKVGADFQLAFKLLSAGELVAIPTETVYGLAANATDEHAVLKIYEAKKRPTFNPLILHVKSIDEFEKYAYITDERIWTLATCFAPGPITFLLPKKSNVLDLVTSGLSSVAIRVPAHPVALELLNMLSFPLAAPSANTFGYISPTTSSHVLEQMNCKIPYILEGGSCDVGIESTIISFLNEVPEILRFGGISRAQIESKIGTVSIPLQSNNINPSAPGMLSSHYAPSIPLYFGELELLKHQFPSDNPAIIYFTGEMDAAGQKFPLSNQADLNEAASNLFRVMRLIDGEKHVDKIYALPFPEVALGFAINDRLKRASKNC